MQHTAELVNFLQDAIRRFIKLYEISQSIIKKKAFYVVFRTFANP